MLKRCLVPLVVAFAWGGLVEAAAAHEMPYEFNDTHVGISIERFMGIDFVDYEGPGNTHASARLLLNASEPVPTSYARLGIDVFIKRFSVGLAGGVTSDDVGILAPRVGYLFGLTPTIGLWTRVGGFYATKAGSDYLGLYAEALLAWFPYSFFAFHMGPTLDIAFTDTPNRDYVAIGIPEFGMTAWF